MEKLLIKIAKSKKHMLYLKLLSRIASLLTSLFFFAQLLVFVLRAEYFLAIKIAVACALGFVAVTLVRRIINAPRPYELRSYYDERPREKVGESFPSRHAYSVFAIATVALHLHLAAGIAIYLLGLAIALCRVLSGMHFIRDVFAGALIGVLTGLLTFLL